MSAKALGTSLKLTFEGKNQLIFPETWFFMLVVAVCVITQMNYLNKVGLLPRSLTWPSDFCLISKVVKANTKITFSIKL